MDIKTMRALALIALGSAFTVAPAQEWDVAQRIPEGVQPRVVYAEVGADGIGRVVSAPGVNMQAAPQLPLYSVMKSSGYFSTAGPSRQDGIGFPAPAYVTEMAIWYFDNSGAGPSDTVDVDFTFFDGTAPGGIGSNDDRAEIIEGGCRGVAGLAIGFVTVTGLPQDSTYSWIVQITLGASSFIAPGHVWVEHRYYNQTFGAGGTTGPILAAGDVVGVPLGVHSVFQFSNYPYQSSGSDSQNRWYNPGTGGCAWFNPYPLANVAYEFRGRYALVCELGGEYGSIGPVLTGAMNKLWVAVADPNDPNKPIYYDVVTVYGEDGTGQVNRWFMLPFMSSGPYEVTVMPFNGFLGKKLTVTPDPVSFSAAVTFPLVRGDANGDNAVNISDLNSILINFGKTGDTP
jgi:hypothetical protein